MRPDVVGPNDGLIVWWSLGSESAKPTSDGQNITQHYPQRGGVQAIHVIGTIRDRCHDYDHHSRSTQREAVSLLLSYRP